jgi:hypothetical protein
MRFPHNGSGLRRSAESHIQFDVVRKHASNQCYVASKTRVADVSMTRLFCIPLIQTLRRILGFNAFLSCLDNFRYAL